MGSSHPRSQTTCAFAATTHARSTTWQVVEGGWVEGIGVTYGYPLDTCLIPELLWLTGQGIHTWSSCCGHGKSDPFILSLDPEGDAVAKLIGLGYRPEVREAEQPFRIIRVSPTRTESRSKVSY